MLGLGSDLCLDLVSRPDAFARLWPKLRAGYLLDALERLDGEATPQGEFEAFFEAVGDAFVSRQASVGLGEDVRLRGQRVIGSGLELDPRGSSAVGVLERGQQAARLRANCATESATMR